MRPKAVRVRSQPMPIAMARLAAMTMRLYTGTVAPSMRA